MEKKKQYTAIIFDLTGVLFAIDKVRVCRSLGLFNLARYLITHRRNPLTTYLETLQALRQFDPLDADCMYYKGYAFPASAAEYYKGTKKSTTVLKELFEGVDRLDKDHYFRSPFEKELIKKSIYANFDSHEQAAAMHMLPKAIDTLKKIHATGRYKLYLLSNFDDETFDFIQKKYPNIFSLFDGIIISASIGRLKPYKNIYDYTLQTYAIDPHSALFIDDQHENLIEPEKLGIDTILCKNSRQLSEALHERLGL